MSDVQLVLSGFPCQQRHRLLSCPDYQISAFSDDTFFFDLAAGHSITVGWELQETLRRQQVFPAGNMKVTTVKWFNSTLIPGSQSKFQNNPTVVCLSAPMGCFIVAANQPVICQYAFSCIRHSGSSIKNTLKHQRRGRLWVVTRTCHKHAKSGIIGSCLGALYVWGGDQT